LVQEVHRSRIDTENELEGLYSQYRDLCDYRAKLWGILENPEKQIHEESASLAEGYDEQEVQEIHEEESLEDLKNNVVEEAVVPVVVAFDPVEEAQSPLPSRNAAIGLFVLMLAVLFYQSGSFHLD
jgi:hypothetical protein